MWPIQVGGGEYGHILTRAQKPRSKRSFCEGQTPSSQAGVEGGADGEVAAADGADGAPAEVEAAEGGDADGDIDIDVDIRQRSPRPLRAATLMVICI